VKNVAIRKHLASRRYSCSSDEWNTSGYWS